MKTTILLSALLATQALYAQTTIVTKATIPASAKFATQTVKVTDASKTVSVQKMSATQISAQQAKASSAAMIGNEGGGGGNAIGDQLFDFAETPVENSKIDVKKLSAYQQVLAILKNVKNKIPGLAIDLEAVANRKNWYMVLGKLSQDSCQDATVVSYQTEVVACQIDNSIYIDKNWYSKVDSTNQAGLLIHEIVRGLIESNEDAKALSKFAREQGIRTLTRMLVFQPQISANDLQQVLYQLKLTSIDYKAAEYMESDSPYKTVAQIASVNQINADITSADNKEIRKILPKKQYFDMSCQISAGDLKDLQKNLTEVLRYDWEFVLDSISTNNCGKDKDCQNKVFLNSWPRPKSEDKSEILQVSNCMVIQNTLDNMDLKPLVVNR